MTVIALLPPGGYYQWQSETVARREGKCREPANNQSYNAMITRTEIFRRTDRGTCVLLLVNIPRTTEYCSAVDFILELILR